MPARSVPMISGAVALAASVLGCAATTGQPRAPEEPRPLYRLDFAVTTTDQAKPPVANTYTLHLLNATSGELKVGSNIALAPSNNRVDVGLRIHCTVGTSGDGLLLHNLVEISSLIDPVATMRKMFSSGVTFVTLGNPTTMASVEDPDTHRRYQVMVTATKVR
jgi:hypothetical protein